MLVEMQTAVMGATIAVPIAKYLPWEFGKIYCFIDSKGLKKETTALKQYMGNQASECLKSYEVKEWHCVKSEDNIANLPQGEDVDIKDVSEESRWENGKEWKGMENQGRVVYEGRRRRPYSQISSSKKHQCSCDHWGTFFPTSGIRRQIIPFRDSNDGSNTLCCKEEIVVGAVHRTV